MPNVAVRIMKVSKNPRITVPRYQTPGAAAFDVQAAIEEPVILKSGTRANIMTGFAYEIPEGFELQLRARSGHALESGIMLVNGVGTIDSDYRGEVGVILYNSGDEAFTITPGMRIAQGVIAPAWQANFDLAGELSSSSRGEGGFGSTGRDIAHDAPGALAKDVSRFRRLATETPAVLGENTKDEFGFLSSKETEGSTG